MRGRIGYKPGKRLLRQLFCTILAPNPDYFDADNPLYLEVDK